jgi:2-polyprenyl-3-methyl-5-hydroxy-6-metoxy-1,4-benzoquinol methylase
MEHVACDLCGSNRSKVRFPSTLGDNEGDQLSAFRCTSSGYGQHHTIVECLDCGLVFANPRYDSGEMLAKYEAVEDPLYVEEREGRVLTFERHLRPLEEIMPPGDGRRLLDVGCHIGVFVEIAARHGWDAWGVEPSQWAAWQAQQVGLQVVEGTMATSGFDDGSFDVVTLWDVIEHLEYPSAELREAHRLLKPGGLLVAHTMDLDSLFARLMGRRWPWLMEMHLYYYSRKTLTMLMEKTGLQVLTIKAQGRYLRLGYLATRVAAFSQTLGSALEWSFARLHLNGRAIPINLGDLVTVYARKPKASQKGQIDVRDI